MSPRQQAMQRVLRAASDVARHWRPGRDSEGEGIIAELLSGLRDLGSVLDRRPPRRPARLRCKLRGAAKCNDEPQYGCSCASCEYREAQSCGQCERDTAFVLEREADALHDAFRAGAEYMRRETRSLAVVIMPDAQRIDAAAAGYVAGLSGPAGDTDEPGADPRMTGGAS